MKPSLSTAPTAHELSGTTLRIRLARAFLGAVVVTAALGFAAILALAPSDLALWEKVGTSTRLTDLGCWVAFGALMAGLAALLPVADKVDAAGKWRS